MPSIFSLDKLGPLPDPFDRERYFAGPKEKTFELFTAYQMRAYAAAEVAKERERCAKLCEDCDTFEYDDPGGFFARLIRSRHD